jgi:iron complex outermembrane receptor protein
VLGLPLALAVPGCAGFAWAQEARPAHRHYQLSAGPLDEALNRFARLAGITLLCAGHGAGTNRPALDADLAVEEALAQLLAGSGLRAVRTPGGGYGLQWQGPARSGNDAIPEQEQRLKQVVIVGRPDGQALHEGRRTMPPPTPGPGPAPIRRCWTSRNRSVVTREEMDARGAASVMDALRYLPGANTQTHGVDPRGYDYFNLRGFINAQNTSNYLNGLRQLVAGFGMFRTESYALERVEVLRGAASATVGQADPGGVVNRISKLAGEGSPNELALSAGTFNMRQLAADLSGTIDEDGQAQARLVALVRDSDTQFRYGNGRAVENDRLYLAPSLKLRLDRDTSLILLADYLKDRNGSSRWTAVAADGRLTHTLVATPAWTASAASNGRWVAAGASPGCPLAAAAGFPPGRFAFAVFGAQSGQPERPRAHAHGGAL